MTTEHWAAVALREAEDRLRKKEAQQLAILEIGSRALQGAGPEELVRAAITGAATGLAVDMAGLLVVAGDSTLVVRGTFGAPVGIDVGTVIAIGRDHAAGRAVLDATVVAVPDYSEQTEFALHPDLVAAGICASLCLPIPGHAAPLGALAFHARQPREWDQDDRGFAEQLAGLVSVSLLRVHSAERAEAKRQRQRHFDKAVFDNLTDMVVACDRDGRVTMVNSAMRGLIGDASTPVSVECLDRLWQRPTEPEGSGGPTDSPLRRALRGEAVRGAEYVVAPPDGAPRTVLIDGSNFHDTDGQLMGAVIVLHDITEKREAETRLAFNELHDRLTGLPNRPLFVDHTRRALQRAGRHGWSTALLAVNLDNFKTVNARVGRSNGDTVLSEAARRLVTAVRPSDSVSRRTDVVARLGGDEFFILCENVGGETDADHIAQRVADALAAPFLVDGNALQLTARMGVALSSRAERDPDMLIMDAETAMRQARALGPGQRCLFVAEMRSRQLARIENEAALRRALDNGEFRLAYQPKVSLQTDRLVGVEALLRWQDPERGLVPPLDFIPLAEETGLIVPIGTWVLHEACTEARRWREAFPRRPPITTSINVSAHQFVSGLTGIIREVLASTGVDPTTICLELTESSVMRDPEFAVSTLRDLKALGLKVSIDDFGTGYSSLAYLRRFPLDELKVDKSFVDGLGRDPEATAIVAAVMGMAHALDLSVVAEGVETEAQVLALRGLGCDEAQGYHYAKPQWPGDIDRLLQGGVLHGGAGTAAPGTAAPAPASSGTVVVVDDAADVRLLARVSLAAAGFHVYESEGGEEALALIRRVRPDCVLLDLKMPGISGLDICWALRADPVTRDTTIVMVSAEGEAPDKAEAFACDVDDYIVKPFSPRDLVNRVAAALRRRRDGGAREEGAATA